MVVMGDVALGALGARPLHGPDVLVVQAVELRAPHPVVPGQVERVPDPAAALFGRADQEHPSQGPVRLPAEVALVLLVDERNQLAPGGQFVGRRQAGKSRPTTATSASNFAPSLRGVERDQ